MAKRTYLTIADLKTLREALAIPGMTPGFKKGLEKKLTSQVESGLMAVAGKVTSRLFGPRGPTVHASLTIGFTLKEVRIYSSWEPAIYMELGYNPFTSDKFIHAKEGKKLAIDASMAGAFKPRPGDTAALNTLIRLKNSWTKAKQDAAAAGAKFRVLQATGARMRYSYEARKQATPFYSGRYGAEKHQNYLSTKAGNIADYFRGPVKDARRSWNEAQSEATIRGKEYHTFRATIRGDLSASLRRASRIRSGAGVFFVDKVQIPQGKDFMSQTLRAWNSGNNRIEYKDLLGKDRSSMLAANWLIESAIGKSGFNLKFGTRKYARVR